MHEDDSSVSWKYEIRPSRQILSVQAKAKARTVEYRPHLPFRLRVAATDARHVPTSMFARQGICHELLAGQV